MGSEMYVKVLGERIIFAAGQALISNIKGEFYNQSRIVPFKQDGLVSKTIYMRLRISLKPTH